MATQTLFSSGMFPVGVSLAEDGQGFSDLPRNMLPAPQLVMLANVAAVTAPEVGDSSVAEEKEMMELKTVGSSYSDSEDEDEGVIRYSYDNQNQREVCIVEYPESPNSAVQPAVAGDGKEDEENPAAENQPPSIKLRSSTVSNRPGMKAKDVPSTLADSAQKKKPFCCKPCHFQGQNEQEFVKHLSTHSISKMVVVNQVEGRSKSKAKEAESGEVLSGREANQSGEAEHKGDEVAGDIKGLIRCERCGYNTNRYDHYISHLKHHSKEGDDHRVFKCTLCAYTTVSQYHWRKHLRNHFPSKLHTCSQCSYFSDRKSNYIQHIRTHTGVRPFQCLYCDYSSSQKTHLTRHMRTHSGERPFKCESCSYLAANQHEVTRHARQVHNGPKPLSCPYCEYKTADRSNFKKHVELHLNPRQFLCPLCKYAASKKCNLQYHIKSRHSGCNVDLDVSKVKLRVKKPGPEGTDDKLESKAAKMDDSPALEEDMDVDEEDDSSPINLSIRRSSRPSLEPPPQSEAPDKAPKKRNTSSEKEKPSKAKEEKKVSIRQRKVKENPVENVDGKEVQSSAEISENKVKKRARRVLTEKTVSQNQRGKSPSLEKQLEELASQEEQPTVKSSEQQMSSERKSEKVLKTTSLKKTKSLGKSRKSAAKWSNKTPEPTDTKNAVEPTDTKKAPELTDTEKIPEPADTKKILEPADTKKSPEPATKKAPEPADTEKASEPTNKESTPKQTYTNKPNCPEKSQRGKRIKEKPLKRKAGQVLDLSQKSSKKKCLKAPADEKLLSKTSSDITDVMPSLTKKTSRETPAKKKKTRTSTRRTSGLQPAVGPKPDDLNSKTSLSSENLEDSVHSSETAAGQVGSSKDGPSTPESDDSPSTQPERIKEESHPTFIKPSLPPRLVLPSQRSKPAEAEDDEGIHSSHEGGSDISDSASEGSDDSGLNGTGATSGKMPNDPETPTEEIPTPTELKSHTCIFCDRTFPLETQYRRHLNRHLVNVYYLDPGAAR
uniref:RE1-silencing transcription factor n=1 Tax=Cyprinodon variegatus TaxID=28743 RepID=A0A3Q2CF67_CYPVA